MNGVITNAKRLASIRTVLRAHNCDSMTALIILVYLAEQGDSPVVMSDLAKANFMTASGISLPVASLVYNKLVDQIRDDEDRRRILVRLSETGRIVAKSILEILKTNN